MLFNSVNWDLIDRLDWIQDMKGVAQDPQWHGEGDVYIHTKMVVDALLKLPEFIALPDVDKHILVAAALLHDVEKRSTSEWIDGHIRSHGHSRRGELTARNILYRDIPYNFKVRETICALIRQHGNPIWWADKPDPNRYVIEMSTEVDTKLLYILAKADNLGRIATDIESQISELDMFRELCIDNNCYGQPYPFKSNLARYFYLNKKTDYADYEPYDESKFTAILMCGVAGAGKDSYVSQNFPTLQIVSLDDIRRANDISPTDKVGNGRVVQEAKEQAKVHMRKRESFVWNATNVTRQMRQQLIDLFTSYGGRVEIHYIEVPYEKLITQNKNREYSVPDAVIERMIGKLEVPKLDEAHEVKYNL
jgi:predicted kinase